MTLHSSSVSSSNSVNSISTVHAPRTPSTESASSTVSATPSEWHRERRRQMILKYGNRLTDLEQNESSFWMGIPLLLVTCGSLFYLSYLSGTALSWYQVIVLAIFPGSMLSLWQLQLLHDVIHGSLLPKHTNKLISPKMKRTIQDVLLFIGSMPSIFGYYLYLKYGHLSHHTHVGMVSSEQVFDSSNAHQFEDGDILFVAHRMNMTGSYGPKLPIPSSLLMTDPSNDSDTDGSTSSSMSSMFQNKILRQFIPSSFITTKITTTPGNNVGTAALATEHDDVHHAQLPTTPQNQEDPAEQLYLRMSIAKSGFHYWKPGATVRNAFLFIASFLFERIMLSLNDIAVALMGRNFFFPHKPMEFQNHCTRYARVAVTVRFVLFYLAGWKSLLFLFLCETIWSLPPHPACAMFITNHGSGTDDTTTTNSCVPTKSTYAGPWYSIFTLGTNYHCEHHDFPTIPFHQLYQLQQIAPEFYHPTTTSHDEDKIGKEKRDNLFHIMKQTFAYPEFYACMNSNIIIPKK